MVYSIITYRPENNKLMIFLFNFFKDELGEFKSESIMTDFEMDLKKSYFKCCPNAIQWSCYYFYLMKAIWKKNTKNSRNSKVM